MRFGYKDYYIKMREKRAKKRNKIFNSTTLLIALCWLVYTCSYLGKLGYNANIAKIETAYNVTHSTAGLVSTFFFIAYGIGQIFNGIFCKKYPIRYIVFGGLVVSGLMNLSVALTDNFALIKYCWLLNGVALSVLWPSLIRFLSENLDKELIGRAVLAMGTTVAAGTFFVYALSALFVALGSYLIMFFVAGILLPTIAVVWFVASPKLAKGSKPNETCERTVDVKTKKQQGIVGLCGPIVVLAMFAIADNLIKDGLTTWVPMILQEIYDLPDYISILLTMLLPLLAILGTSVAVALHKKIKDFVLLSSIFFLVSAVFIGIVILFLPTGWFIVTLGSFGVVSCLMAGVNNVIINMVPLYWKEKINSGLLAGVLNGFCYLGSTLSAYGLGLIADFGGWYAVFWALFIVCMIAVLLAVFYVYFIKLKKKSNNL